MDETFDRVARRGLATRAQLIAAGLPAPALHRTVAAGDLVTVHRDVFARQPLAPAGQHLLTAAGPDEAYLRHVHAALLAVGPESVAWERTAAVLWRLDMLVEPADVHLAVPRNRTRCRFDGVHVTRRSAPDHVAVAGLRAAPLVDTLAACARSRPTVEAVTLVDSALRRRLIALPALAGAASRGSRLHRAVQLADPRSGSVLESALRVLLVQHGLAPPRSQYVIRAGGRFVARVDFCWPALGLIVEADGRRWHDPEDRRHADRLRANACAVQGWRILRFTWDQVLGDSAYVVRTVRAALTRAA